MTRSKENESTTVLIDVRKQIYLGFLMGGDIKQNICRASQMNSVAAFSSKKQRLFTFFGWIIPLKGEH